MQSEKTTEQLKRVKLDDSWKYPLVDSLTGARMQHLKEFLKTQQQQNKLIYPPNAQIFRALNETPLSEVKAVILGQDPYHGVGQANGLSFSVNKGIDLPPSLRNIYHELKTDLDINPPRHGDLSAWAKQGVLLLNSVLTVERAQPASHQKQGWEEFTDAVIDVINEQRQSVVFILWGAYAQRKGQRIDTQKHLVLKAAHPSPLSANRGGFFGCKVFSKTNEYLIQHGIEPINWQLDA
ncbi:uracil-DNA glycosylase [Acinetobacter qingfengensis]|uniref:Uracil-DNA glycosylase n=1 Tax=Acinetobacter qingfengensis TaxID=1262585 RepID=A0A1E7R5N0_9GAMM|nr:uracil-DNA glycosylase [Acinetobacter qingfengensis]KAA8735599.1 uracil-DNA glycosylase [Acinetobacter qingfengensis]OEY94634.1 uracil-DNA glycosylase [Acinetobacter qingfengensis]